MPNTKSQKERMRLSAKQTVRNKTIKSSLRTTVKKANASIEANSEDKVVLVNNAQAALAKAAGKGIIHKNTASRRISRMAKRANKAQA